MHLYLLLFDEILELNLIFFLPVDYQLCGPVFDEENISLLVSDLTALVDGHFLFWLQRFLFYRFLLCLLCFFSCDFPFGEENLFSFVFF